MSVRFGFGLRLIRGFGCVPRLSAFCSSAEPGERTLETLREDPYGF